MSKLDVTSSPDKVHLNDGIVDDCVWCPHYQDNVPTYKIPSNEYPGVSGVKCTHDQGPGSWRWREVMLFEDDGGVPHYPRTHPDCPLSWIPDSHEVSDV